MSTELAEHLTDSQWFIYFNQTMLPAQRQEPRAYQTLSAQV